MLKEIEGDLIHYEKRFRDREKNYIGGGWTFTELQEIWQTGIGCDNEKLIHTMTAVYIPRFNS